MPEDEDLYVLLRRLEESLMQPAVREDSATVASLLEDDFVEVGKSGRTYDKPAILEELRRETADSNPPQIVPSVCDFTVNLLSPEIALVTYRSVRNGPAGSEEVLRCSVWQRRDGAWRLRFHQGTPSERGK
jgi:hypothetical protein